MTRLKAPAGLVGPSGLVSAIISRAAQDAMGTGGASNVIDAWAYFNGPEYQDHMAWLDLPADWLPEPLIDMTPTRFMRVTSLIIRSKFEL
jgi:hypothetical protein